MAEEQSWTVECNDRPIVFHTRSELEDWTQKELNAWQVFQDAHCKGVDDVKERIKTARGELKTALDIFRSSGPPGDLARILNRIFAERKLVYSGSPEGQFIFAMQKTDDWCPTLTALSVLLGANVTLLNEPASSGFVRGHLFRLGAVARIESMQGAIESWMREFGTKLEDRNSEMRAEKAKIEKLRDQAQSQLDAQQEQFAKAEAAREEARAANESLYREKLRLESPVRYWTDKATDHRK